MDKKTFFDVIRNTFGKLTQGQVSGIEALLAACAEWGVDDTHHVANILAQVAHETGLQMEPVKETVYATSKDRNPSDKLVIQRLDNAYKNGLLPWVKVPYWRDGWFGRGLIQLTHRHLYERVGKAIGVDLVTNRDAALDLKISAAVAVVGMAKGLFTGKKLSDYVFPEALGNTPKDNPRRIVNGNDGTDAKVAKLHNQFYTALVAAGHGTPVTQRTVSVIIAEIEKLVAELKALGA